MDAIDKIKFAYPHLTVACDVCLCATNENGLCCKYKTMYEKVG